ncbi:hypothetical protein H2199_008983 [Coniosporium tulheliwenetii]|uniref:Uncharacterized protein n=1 Tax=Coniosporium tulheliwenetii TaxID=3383036 RepID=A0ACC2YH29_9PEZI|nr:hypothetical protein H2199_008983 [Cladosporium sp. JES 115]
MIGLSLLLLSIAKLEDEDCEVMQDLGVPLTSRLKSTSPTKVHVYNIPPATSRKSYTAATWTANSNQHLIFTARLRILETAMPAPPSYSSHTFTPSAPLGPQYEKTEIITTTLPMKDPRSGELFAVAPYTALGVSIEERVQEGLIQALWKHLNQITWAKAKESDRDYVLGAFRNLAVENDPPSRWLARTLKLEFDDAGKLMKTDLGAAEAIIRHTAWSRTS